MEWIDEAIVLGVKRHGETSVILELMTHGHGRHLGLVRGGSGARLRGILQPGNAVRATWRARLDEHLGLYAVEGSTLRVAGFRVEIDPARERADIVLDRPPFNIVSMPQRDQLRLVFEALDEDARIRIVV